MPISAALVELGGTEDESRSFFALLHNRVAYPPQDWAPFDSRQLILSFALGHFDVEYTVKCVVMYGPRYGELVYWDNFVDALSDVGFAARNSSGSAVIFENESLGEEGHSGGKIVFHKPHPVSKIESGHAALHGEEDGKVVWLV